MPQIHLFKSARFSLTGDPVAPTPTEIGGLAMKNYTGKQIDVGIDVHKKTYAVTCLYDGEVLKRDTLVADPKCLVEYLNKYFPNSKIKTAYEAGFSGFGLHRYLLKKGIENIVVHPASIEISARDRVKTDKRDSLKIAVQLSSGRLRGIYVPDEKREAYREVTRLREKVMRDRKRVGNRLKSLASRQSLLYAEDNRKVTKKWIDEIKQCQCDESVKYFIQVCTDEWIFLNNQLKDIDAKLAIQAQFDLEFEKIYRSAPGIGEMHARILANELEDMKQFSNEKQLFSFTGLTPSEYSSGEHKRLGHISRQGRSLLRKVLIQAAWTAIKKDQSLGIIFSEISKRVGKKRAIVGIARRLIGRIRTCFKTNTLYQYIKNPVNEGACKVL